jgi:hypothetical protein
MPGSNPLFIGNGISTPQHLIVGLWQGEVAIPYSSESQLE